MSCCVEPKALTKGEFITAKLKNFHAFIEPHCSTEDQKKVLATYTTVEDVMPFLLQVVAAHRLGKQDALLNTFCASFPSADDAFRSKLSRYMNMFCEVLTT